MKEVKQHFWKDIYDENGKIRKEKLAEIIFNDKQSLHTINSIIHPGTLKKYHQWLNNHKNEKYTIHESAILFENSLQHHFDKIINISAPKKIRLERVTGRDNISEKVVLERMKNQLPDKEKNKLADFVIINDGSAFLIPQLIEIDKKIKGL